MSSIQTDVDPEGGDRTADTETRVLDAAEAVFADVGFLGATTAAIAERAGVTKASVHYYFRTKESLHGAVLERLKEGLVELMLPDLEQEEPLAAVLSAVRRYCQFLADHPRYVRLCLFDTLEGNRHLSNTSMFEKLIAVTTAALVKGMEQGVFRRVDPQHAIITIDSLCAHFFEHEAELKELFADDCDRETRVERHIEHVVEIIQLALVERHVSPEA